MVPTLWTDGVDAALAWALHRSLPLVIFVVFALLLILNLGYWQEMLETFVLVLAATTLSIILGIPVGILAAHKPWMYTILRPTLDLMQTIPTFVYLIPTLVLFGLGVVPGLISTIIFAIAAPIRLTYLGISRVPEDLKIGTNIAIMESAKVIQHGKPEEIVLNPSTAYVADFVAHTNPLNVLRGRSLMT